MNNKFKPRLFSKDTSHLLRFIAVSIVIRISFRIWQLFRPDRFDLEMSALMVSAEIACEISLTVALLFAKQRMWLISYGVLCLLSFFGEFLQWKFGLTIDYRRDEALMSTASMAIGWLYCFYLLTTAKVFKNYFAGLPSREINPETGKAKWRISDYGSPWVMWTVIAAQLLLSVPNFRKFAGWENDRVSREDAAGYRQRGDVEILMELQEGSVRFRWEGKPVSFVRITEGTIDEMDEAPWVWTRTANEKYQNCMNSPVVYGTKSDDCALAVSSRGFASNKNYTVFIARYSYEGDSYFPSGWAAMEFDGATFSEVVAKQ